jgi:hypothetical protein
MIQNEHQYKVTQTKLRELEKGFTDLLDAKDRLAPVVAQEMLGTKEQVIQRYESSGYNGASLRRLKEVASHLSA